MNISSQNHLSPLYLSSEGGPDSIPSSELNSRNSSSVNENNISYHSYALNDTQGSDNSLEDTENFNQRIKFIQINLQHAKAATYELTSLMAKDSIALVQEPWFYKGRPMGLTPILKALHAPNKGCPRAAIYIHSSLQVMLVPQISDRDLVAAIRKILLISWYWPVNTELPNNIIEAISYAQSLDMQFILCADTNAHSPVWGDKRQDLRGIKMEDFLLDNQIHLLNVGSKPTYVSSRGSSHIDLTGISSIVRRAALNWSCREKASHSDHQIIQFGVKVPFRKVIIRARSYEDCDWKEFS
jgi:hypothetical protein